MRSHSPEVSGDTRAAEQGMTEEIGRTIASVAASEMAAGRMESARAMLEGLAVSNPYDPAPWAMLALVHRRRGNAPAARLCAEVALQEAPEDPQVRLVRAEVLLAFPEERQRAREDLAILGRGDAEVAPRARALLAVLAGGRGATPERVEGRHLGAPPKHPSELDDSGACQG